MNKKHIKLVLITVFIQCLPLLLLAEGPGGPGDDPDVPIDGGLSLLLASGAGYVTIGYQTSKKLT